MSAVLSFHELLERAGARPGRGKKWHCPRCQGHKAPALAVSLEKECYHCHRCQWRGGRRSLERELGISAPRLDAAEVNRRRTIRREARCFAAWLKAERLRSAALLRNIGAAELVLREQDRAALEAGQPIPERTWAKLHFAARIEERELSRYERLSDPERHIQELVAMYRAALEAEES